MSAPLEPVKNSGRSWVLKELVAGFVLLSVTGWLRMYAAIFDWSLLTSLGMVPGPFYLCVYGLVTGLAGLVAGVGLWLRISWAPSAARSIAVGYSLWFWADRILFTRSTSGWTNWPFALAVTALCLLFVFLVLDAPPVKWFSFRSDR